MTILRSSGALVLVASLCAFGCKRDGGTSGSTSQSNPGAEITAAARTEATGIFATRCTPCHGPSGGGDGPASAGLTPHPRNFHDAQWQESVTDAHIERIIQYGGAAVGKSAAMPANPDLNDKPAVVAALREHIRSLRGR
jgi:mono/diheme cytochrome c family protein